jgi:hypothetical protein
MQAPLEKHGPIRSIPGLPIRLADLEKLHIAEQQCAR